MTAKTGRHLIIEQFLADGFTHMYGNPGTVEQGFLDALAGYRQLRYVLTLQESVAVMAADAHARATRRPALVQIHSAPGLGNAIGALYQAKRGHAPLVVIGGDAGIRYLPMDAQMAADLVGMAAPVTKWATMVQHPASLLRVLRRAIKTAATPPMGPVYVCLPMDVLDEAASEPVRPTSIPSTRVTPDAQWIGRAADLLAAARRPVIYVGDGIAYSEAQPELERVADTLGSDVWGVDSGELNLRHDHPLYQGQTGHMFGSHSLAITRGGDVNLVVGTYMLPEVFPELGDIFANGATTIHIDLNAYEIAKNHPVELGVVADPKPTLAALAEALAGRLGEGARAAARERAEAQGKAKAEARAQALAEDAKYRDATPLHFSRFIADLAPRLPADVVVFDEALTNSPALTRHLPATRYGHFFQTRGGSLGVGVCAAVGLQAALPGKTVLAVAGDGATMYTVQALWTAARHNLPIKLVVCNNASYRLLQLNISQYWMERQIPHHDFPLPFDLSKPSLRFVDLARGMGVEGRRVETAADIGPAIDAMLGHDGPFVVDLVLEGEVHPELIGVRCGQ